jgi:hypothetical protein
LHWLGTAFTEAHAIESTMTALLSREGGNSIIATSASPMLSVYILRAFTIIATQHEFSLPVFSNCFHGMVAIPSPSRSAGLDNRPACGSFHGMVAIPSSPPRAGLGGQRDLLLLSRNGGDSIIATPGLMSFVRTGTYGGACEH